MVEPGGRITAIGRADHGGAFRRNPVHVVTLIRRQPGEACEIALEIGGEAVVGKKLRHAVGTESH